MTNPLELTPDDADILVERHEWERAIAPLSIGTLALGPCVGIILYGKNTREGFVGHFVHPKVDTEDVEEMLSSVLLNNKPDDLKAWLRGGHLMTDDEEDSRYAIAGREHVVHLLSSLNITDCDIQWNDHPLSWVDVILDCQTGRFNTFIDSWE